MLVAAREILLIPFLDAEYRRFGFGGQKVENLYNDAGVFRPRVDVYLRDRISASLSYIPPIELFGVKSSLLSGSINWRALEVGRFALGLRGFGQTGEVQGAFTCNEAQAAIGFDPERFEINFE